MKRPWLIAGLVTLSLVGGTVFGLSRRSTEVVTDIPGPRLESEIGDADYVVIVSPDQISESGPTSTPWGESATEYIVDLNAARVVRIALNPDVLALEGKIAFLRSGSQIDTLDELVRDADEVVLLLDHLVVRGVTLGSVLRVVDGTLLPGDWADVTGELSAFESVRKGLGLSLLEALEAYGQAADQIDTCESGPSQITDQTAAALVAAVRETNATCVAAAAEPSPDERW